MNACIQEIESFWKGLRQNGAGVVEYNVHSTRLSKPYTPSLSLSKYVKKYIRLMEKHAKLYYDVLVTSYSGQLVIPLFDALIFIFILKTKVKPWMGQNWLKISTLILKPSLNNVYLS